MVHFSSSSFSGQSLVQLVGAKRTPLSLLLLLLLVSTSAEHSKSSALRNDRHQNNPNNNLPPPPADDQQPLLQHQHRSLIVGGGPAPLGRYDAFVWSGDQGGWGCGGAMIAPDVFLTAAHCQPAFELAGGAFVGTYFLNATTTEDATMPKKKKHSGDGTFYPLGVLFPHPKHKEPSNDVMLVKLRHAHVENPYEINRQRDFPQMGDSIGLVGFGLTAEDGEELSPVLKEVTVDVYEFDICHKVFAKKSGLKLSDDLHLCSGTMEGGRDGCDSDSGTPLLVGNTVVGVTNDGIGCARPNVPAYNARVSTFASWIDESLCVLSDFPPPYCLTYPFSDQEQERQKEQCRKYELSKSGLVSFESFLVSVFVAFVGGAVSMWMITHYSRYDKRRSYRKLMDDDSMSTVETEQPSPTLSTFSDKF